MNGPRWRRNEFYLGWFVKDFSSSGTQLFSERRFVRK